MLMEWVERFEKEKENKLSKADKMFEELGYTKKVQELEFHGCGIPLINYSDNVSYKTITFNLIKKFTSMSCVNKDFEKVLQAINEKCKELEWL